MKKLKIMQLIIISGILFLSAADLQAATVKSLDGVPLVYTDQGKGGPALVFVHCWSCNKGFWEAQVPYFSKKYRVVTMDLAGHGDSGKNRDKWTIEAYARDVAVVVKTLKLKKIILIGHSMGGPVVLTAAGLMKEKVVGIIGVDTLTHLERKVPEAQFEQFTAPMREDFVKGTRNFIGLFMFTPQSDPKLKERIIKEMTAADPKIALASMKSLFMQDLAAVADKFKVHIRCINARRNAASIEQGKRHAASYKVSFMDEVGHFLHMEKPAEFNKLLEAAVDELKKL